jgi:hypothetical protein
MVIALNEVNYYEQKTIIYIAIDQLRGREIG